jgi:hypothetical protein
VAKFKSKLGLACGNPRSPIKQDCYYQTVYRRIAIGSSRSHIDGLGPRLAVSGVSSLLVASGVRFATAPASAPPPACSRLLARCSHNGPPTPCPPPLIHLSPPRTALSVPHPPCHCRSLPAVADNARRELQPLTPYLAPPFLLSTRPFIPYGTPMRYTSSTFSLISSRH